MFDATANRNLFVKMGSTNRFVPLRKGLSYEPRDVLVLHALHPVPVNGEDQLAHLQPSGLVRCTVLLKSGIHLFNLCILFSGIYFLTGYLRIIILILGRD